MPDRRDPASAYRAAGVDLEASDRFKEKLKGIVGGTPSEGVVGGLGGFGGCFTLAGVGETTRSWWRPPTASGPRSWSRAPRAGTTRSGATS